jgi:uroporphyrinogen-III decarboxylase
MNPLAAMTPRQRWLAALRLEPVDRLPFWPKLDGAYVRAQRLPFQKMTVEAIHDWIGSDQHVWVGDGLRETRRCTSVETQQTAAGRRTVYRAPCGETEQVQLFDEATQSCHPVRFPVRSLEDVRLMTAIYEDVSVELDREAVAEAQRRVREIGEGALTATGIGESPLMYWIEWLAGVETAHYLLADHPGEVEALFAAMDRVLRRRAELLAETSPADVLYLIENTSTTLISPEQYRRHCLGHVGEYARIVQGAGRMLVLHMCGHLKALLPELRGIPARAFEAFTSPPVGNATLAEGRAACPNVCLIGGTNATLWLRSAKEIVARLGQDLGALPHHRGIVVTSGGMMPPMASPETVRSVCRWIRRYPAGLD